MIEFSILGLDELKKRFATYSKEVRGKKMEGALAAGGMVIVNDAKRRVPVLTGNLRRSLHVGGHSDSGGTGDLGRPPQKEGEVAVYVGTNVDYAGAVEYGTGPRPPKPYLRPAFDTNRGAVEQEVAAALNDLLRRG